MAVVADENLAADDSTRWPGLVDEHGPMSAPLWIYWSRKRALVPAVQPFVRRVQETGGTAHRDGGSQTS